MACHLKYFDTYGYFYTRSYVKNMGIEIEEGTAGSKKLSEEDLKRLERTISLADSHSRNRKLEGIIELIQLVEDLQKKYGLAHEHTHTPEGIKREIFSKPDLAKAYSSETRTNTAQQVDSQQISGREISR